MTTTSAVLLRTWLHLMLDAATKGWGLACYRGFSKLVGLGFRARRLHSVHGCGETRREREAP